VTNGRQSSIPGEERFDGSMIVELGSILERKGYSNKKRVLCCVKDEVEKGELKNKLK
jgi:hypothetical protein